MAILYSNYAVVQNKPTAITMLDALEATPTTRTVQPLYTMTGAEVNGDTIYLEKVPAGTIVIPFLSNVYSDAVATTGVGTVGDAPTSAKDLVAASTNRYSTGLDVAAAGVDPFTGGAAATVPYQTLSERWLTFTFTTLTVPVAGKKLQFNITRNVVT